MIITTLSILRRFSIALFSFFLFLPLAFAVETEVGEVKTFGEYISQIWAWGTQVIFGVSVIMLIVGGVMYMASSGDEERVDNAKQVISGALISTVLMLFSGILFAVLQKPTGAIEGSATLNDATEVIKNITNILLGAVGGVSVITLIYNGIQYMLSAGDPDKLDGAKRGLKFSLIGLGVALGAYFILQWVISIIAS